MNFKEAFEDLKHYDLRLQQAFLKGLAKDLAAIHSDLAQNDSLSLQLKSEYQYSLNKLLILIIDLLNDNKIKSTQLESFEFVLNELLRAENYFSNVLTESLKRSFATLEVLELSWEHELDIEPVNRYTVITGLIPFDIYRNATSLDRKRYDNYSAEDFSNLNQEFQSIIGDVGKKHVLSVDISYAYANVLLPKAYDIVFDVKDRRRFWKKKTIIRCAFNYRDIFHMDLWRGHHSHCLVEFIGDLPEIVNELPDLSLQDYQYHDGIGLCTAYDWDYIKNA